ncbi:MAG: HEPN domain-containing protein [Fibromonadales bacterium]|nr:HEPN domain-containing protein [Fibromonadales bacterium]
MQNEEIKKNPWIFYADNSLAFAETAVGNDQFTGEVAFLCQQAVEKYLKAVLFELKIPIQKTHDLAKLYDKIKEFKDLNLDEALLDILCDLYIESRYPTDIALLDGKILPSVENAKTYFDFAKSVENIVKTEIEILRQASTLGDS